jgi:lysylphosphatidylglycerol synthetase-like protein (DUF2156 family)
MEGSVSLFVAVMGFGIVATLIYARQTHHLRFRWKLFFRFFASAIGLITLIIIGGIAYMVAAHTRQPWAYEKVKFEAVCPSLPANEPGELAFQCWLYSKFGKVYE